jgi:hypothetical protein
MTTSGAWYRRMRFVAASNLGFLLLSTIALAQQPLPPQPRGVPARAAASEYATHVQIDGITYTASLVPADEVKHIFAFDITKTYVVFEVGIYPGGARVQLDPDGFVVRLPQTGDVAHRADSVTVASVIQQKNLPKPPSKMGPVVASTEVGYESGTDPYTGRRVHGTYTASQVGVGMGNDPGPPAYPSPGGYPQDRQLLERQLWEKSLPGGSIQHPTAGYLYFPASLLKKKVNGLYQLEYLGPQDQINSQTAGSLQKVELRIPARSR